MSRKSKRLANKPTSSTSNSKFNDFIYAPISKGKKRKSEHIDALDDLNSGEESLLDEKLNFDKVLVFEKLKSPLSPIADRESVSTVPNRVLLNHINKTVKCDFAAKLQSNFEVVKATKSGINYKSTDCSTKSGMDDKKKNCSSKSGMDDKSEDCSLGDKSSLLEKSEIKKGEDFSISKVKLKSSKIKHSKEKTNSKCTVSKSSIPEVLKAKIVKNKGKPKSSGMNVKSTDCSIKSDIDDKSKDCSTKSGMDDNSKDCSFGDKSSLLDEICAIKKGEDFSFSKGKFKSSNIKHSKEKTNSKCTASKSTIPDVLKEKVVKNKRKSKSSGMNDKITDCNTESVIDDKTKDCSTKSGMDDKSKDCSLDDKSSLLGKNCAIKKHQDFRFSKVKLRNLKIKRSKENTNSKCTLSKSTTPDVLKAKVDKNKRKSKSSCNVHKNEASGNLLSVVKACVNKYIDEPSLEVCESLTQACSKKFEDILKSAVKHVERCGREQLTASDFQIGLLVCKEEKVLPSLPSKGNQQESIMSSLISDTETDLPKSECFPIVSQTWLNNDNPLSKDPSELSDELKLYFQLVTAAVQNSDESLAITLEDLKTNKNIVNLVPFFVEFISAEILANCSDFSKLTNILLFIETLLLNPFLFFGNNFKNLAYLLLKCLLHPSHSFNQFYDFRLLKDKIAYLLVRILERNDSQKLWFEILFVLEATFCDENKPFCTHYGALAAVNLMGVSAVNTAVLPNLIEYFEHLNSVDKFDYPAITDSYAVKDQLLCSIYLITSHIVQSKLSKRQKPTASLNFDNTQEKAISEIVSDYFGDTVVQYFPLLDFVSCKTKKCVTLESRTRYSKKRICSKRRSWLSQKATDKTKTDYCLMNLMFDIVPLKKHSIKFGSIYVKM